MARLSNIAPSSSSPRVVVRRATALVHGLVAVVTLGAACTGASFGERAAGDDTHLESWDYVPTGDGRLVGLGSIGVAPMTETSYVLQTVVVDDDEDGEPDPSTKRKRLFAVAPEADEPGGVVDLSRLSDLRVVFPGEDVVVLGEEDGADSINFLDPVTLAMRNSVPALDRARYHGTRLSPSGRYLAVCDNNVDTCPLHVVDLDGLTTEVLPHDGAWLEAQWNHDSDTLFVAVFYDDDPDTEADETRARLLSFPMAAVEACGYRVEDGVWCGAELDVEIPGAARDFLFSFTWIGIAPDDRTVAVPVLLVEAPAVRHALALVDTASGAVRTVDDAYGPVSFTPDGSTVVSYRYRTEDPPPCDEDDPELCPGPATVAQLALVDVEDLAVDTIDLPGIRAPSYFVTRTGNLVVVAEAFGLAQLVLADLDNGATTRMSGPALTLGSSEFVNLDDRGEMWVADDGLFAVDLLDGSVEQVLSSLSPHVINRLATHDRLVMDDGSATSLVFVDPVTQTVTKTTPLPLPPRADDW